MRHIIIVYTKIKIRMKYVSHYSRRCLSERDAFHCCNISKVYETTLDRPLSMTFRELKRFLSAFHHIRRGFPCTIPSDIHVGYTLNSVLKDFKVSHHQRGNEK